jgi:hypothetical protein
MVLASISNQKYGPLRLAIPPGVEAVVVGFICVLSEDGNVKGLLIAALSRLRESNFQSRMSHNL